jgi:tetratricopeptide (TPR) repeat protein
MKFSDESIRRRWIVMVLAWAAVTTLLFVHASIVDQYLQTAGSLGLRGAPAASTPFQSAYPAFAADAQTWVRHALSLLEGDSIRLRYTTIDNAPSGREVHWNSAWAWVIALAGQVDHWLTGRPVPQAIERVSVWLNPLVFSVLIVVISAWVARRMGAVLGVFVALAMVGHPRVSEGFFPGYVDHHGLLAVAVLGLVMGGVVMGAGWWRERGLERGWIGPVSPDDVRKGAIFSALSGAMGMWVSAASTIAPIGIMGVAGLGALLLLGGEARRGGAVFDGSAWRLWGRVGGLASLFFYLVEYFPNHMGLRLESNHPVYALAWWGGGELIAELGERWLAGRAAWGTNLKRLALPVAAILVAPLIIIIGGTQVFIVMDPFLSALHNRYIQEFLPLWRSIRGTGWNTFFSVVGFENIPLLVAIGTLAILRRRAPLVLWFATFAAAAFTAMAWMQSRWLLNASGSQVTLALVLVVFFVQHRPASLRWAVAIVSAGLIFLPAAITRIVNGREDLRLRRVAPKDAQSALARDVASALRASSPQGEITVLASPNASTSVGYYGRFKTLGTLYWENCEGLKSAAAVFSARTHTEAAALVKKFGITHIAMISDENFVEQYNRLLYPNATDAEIKQSFGYQLMIDRSVPAWLQMIPYKVPDDLSSLSTTVLLFKVAFEQTPADALYHIALGKVALGLMADAERDFDTLIKDSPNSFQPWMRKGEILLARHDWAAAAEAMFQGISRAPAAQRPGMFAIAARNFYDRNQPLQAIQLYRAALKDRFDPMIGAYLAFILATTTDDKLRNGRDAEAIAVEALKSDPNSATLLNSLAAAQAESGKFAEAIATAERAIAVARMKGETAVVAVTEERLRSFKAGKPLRK